MLTSRIKDEFFEQTQSAQDEVSDANSYLWSSLEAWRHQLDKTIATRPGACLIAALTVGIVLGWWTKRK